eukprot:gene14725-19793_t
MLQVIRTVRSKMFSTGGLLIMLSLIFCGVLLGLEYCSKLWIGNSFDKIFTERYDSNNPYCVGRDRFKQTVRFLVNQSNVIGLIFITGPKNSGKTTVIKSAIADREYIAYINWREKSISSKEDLNSSLKKAFKISEFKDLWKNVNFGILGTFWNVFNLPRFKYSDSTMANLIDTLDEIEETLKYAKANRKNKKMFSIFGLSNDVTSRPVIFIDEVGSLKSLVQHDLVTAELFSKWLIKMSKDKSLCDVIMASHDGFSLKTLALADPQYVTTVVMNDFTKDEMNTISRKYYHWWEPQSVPVIDFIHDKVGGHAGHVLKLFDTSININETIKTYQLTEKTTLELIKKNGTCGNSFIYSFYSQCNYYAKFTAVMNALLAERNSTGDDHPKLPVDTVLRLTKINEEVIHHFVNLGWLFYDPTTASIQSRNKIMLNVFHHVNKYTKEWNEKYSKCEESILFPNFENGLAIKEGCNETLMAEYQREMKEFEAMN